MVTWKDFIKGKYPATVHQWLLLSSCFSCFLLLGRVIATGKLTYLFLPWNLFLAFIPYWITGSMQRNPGWIESKLKFICLLGAWLLFMPNSFYIITDLFHLVHIDSAPKWFDVLMIFSFAWNGILPGVISLRSVELMIGLKGFGRYSLPILFIVIWLCAFGIYIGRFLRFNSWDVLTDPFSLASEIADMVFHPFQNSYAWGMTLVYSFFMCFLYLTMKKLSESFLSEK